MFDSRSLCLCWFLEDIMSFVLLPLTLSLTEFAAFFDGQKLVYDFGWFSSNDINVICNSWVFLRTCLMVKILSDVPQPGMKTHWYDPHIGMTADNVSLQCHECHDLIGNVKETYSSVISIIFLVSFFVNSFCVPYFQ